MSPAKFSSLCTEIGIDARASARLSSNGYVWTDDLNRYWRDDGTRSRTGDGTGKVARLTGSWAAEERAASASPAAPAHPPPFPSNIDGDLPDGRHRRPGLVTFRLGQDRFRSALFELYGHRCRVSGCSVEEVLQAAHVEPHTGANNRLNNGMLLRADLHNLYDAGLMWVEPTMEGYKLLTPPHESRERCPDPVDLIRQCPSWSRTG
ncbi:HNH endonuclease [Actinoplanes xinjiangensis]|uniref:HNH endonuclease n=1 Tax=Actinoplanes xinjiangensis TaxID=512350 RepID=UPI00344AF29C